MPFIAPELIIQAKQMDLLTYLKNYEPYELVKFSGNTYCTRTHDSLKISNGKWIWWSRGIGGRSALDYLIKVKGYSFLEAVETIIGHTAIQAPVYEKPQPKEENKPLLLPEKCASNRVITEYLFGRGIDFEIINYCISNNLIFESLPYHNVVFVGYDEMKEPKYAAYRSTNKRRIMGDCSGSKKDYSFRLASRLIVGATFIFSGFVKAIDPTGSAIKFEEYFSVLGIGFLSPLSLFFGVVLAAFEFLLGININEKYGMK